MMADGLSTKEIARRLDLSNKTIETHRHQIMWKLQVSGVAAVTKYAIRVGLTTLDMGEATERPAESGCFDRPIRRADSPIHRPAR